MIREALSYDMIATWIKVRDQQYVGDESRESWRAFDRMRLMLDYVVTPWRCDE